VKYPTEFTDDVLARHSHVTDRQLMQDWADTTTEVRRLKRVQHAERIIAENALDANERRMAAFKADARTQQIAEREEFAAFLLGLDKARRAKERAS